jgi:hypothetical protein
MERSPFAARFALDAQVLLVPLVQLFLILCLKEDAADSCHSFHGFTCFIL